MHLFFGSNPMGAGTNPSARENFNSGTSIDCNPIEDGDRTTCG